MTTRKRLRIAVWIVLIAIAGVAGISYLHIFHTRISWSDSRVFAVTISDGSLRIVHLSGEFNASYVQDSPLEEYADRWKYISIKALAWHRSNQISFKEMPISYVAVGGSFIAPLAVILGFFLIVWVVRQRRHPGIIREIITPSDRHAVGTIRRVIRRLVVVTFGLATLLAVATWVVSYTGLPTDYKWQFERGTVHVLSLGGPIRNTVMFGDRPYVDSSLFSSVHEGRVELSYVSRIAKGTFVPKHELELAGFRWRQVVANRTWLGCGLSMSEATSESLATTNELTRGVEFPGWAPVLLFSAWPIIAFIRGPYRRAGRRANGFCYKCGYNLYGLVEPRCPECGTPTKPGQVSAPRTKGDVSAHLDDLH